MTSIHVRKSECAFNLNSVPTVCECGTDSDLSGLVTKKKCWFRTGFWPRFTKHLAEFFQLKCFEWGGGQTQAMLLRQDMIKRFEEGPSFTLVWQNILWYPGCNRRVASFDPNTSGVLQHLASGRIFVFFFLPKGRENRRLVYPAYTPTSNGWAEYWSVQNRNYVLSCCCVTDWLDICILTWVRSELHEVDESWRCNRNEIWPSNSTQTTLLQHEHGINQNKNVHLLLKIW